MERKLTIPKNYEKTDLVFVAKKSATCTMYDLEGNVIPTPTIEESMNVGNESRVPFRQNGLWGWLDKSGKMIITPQFLEIRNFYKGFAPVKVSVQGEEKWGVVNLAGKLVITPDFEAIQCWGNVCYCQKNGKWGALLSGVCVLPFIYDRVWLQKGCFLAKHDEKWDVLKLDEFHLNLVLSDLEEIPYLNAPLILYKKNGKYGFLNQDFQVVVPAQFENASLISEGRAFVKKSPNERFVSYFNRNGVTTESWFADISDAAVGESFNEKGVARPSVEFAEPLKNQTQYFEDDNSQNWDLINEHGEYITVEPYPFSDCGWFRCGFAPASQKNKWGILDLDGRWIVTPQFEHVLLFNDGNAVVRLADKEGLIHVSNTSKEGFEWIVSPVYDEILGLGGNFRRIRRGDKWGVVNSDGKEILTTLFDEFERWNNVLLVKQNGKWGLADQQGNIFVSPQYDLIKRGKSNVLPFMVVCKNDKCGILSDKGELILPVEFDDIWY